MSTRTLTHISHQTQKLPGSRGYRQSLPAVSASDIAAFQTCKSKTQIAKCEGSLEGSLLCARVVKAERVALKQHHWGPLESVPQLFPETIRV